MENLNKEFLKLEIEFENAYSSLDIKNRELELEKLENIINNKDFWSDNLYAQSVIKQQTNIKNRIEPWIDAKKNIQEFKELIGLNDPSLKEDLLEQFNLINNTFNKLKEDLKYGGKYDDHDAVLTLSAGAGGTDAQDWTAMLMRMYSRWAEQNDFEITLNDEAVGEEAGLKRATFEISGPFAYGKLAGESGVHRLVRLSPFNSDNLRQTSFAKVEVMPKIDKPEELELDPKDLKIDVYRAGGHGGQSVNTTDSAVRITHIPTGITVAIQNERSQLQNKETAMTILRSRLASLMMEQHKEKIDELKGPNQSAEWGNQIRSYVLHPYKQVKDLRTKYETSDVDSVLDGKINPLIEAYLNFNIS